MFYLRSIAVFFLCSTCSSNILQPSMMQTYEGSGLNIPCEHPALTTGDYIHWYKLSPGQGLMSLIRDFKDAKSEDNKYQLIFNKDRKSSTLVASNMRHEDSAVYLCAQRGSGGYRLTFGQGTWLTVTPKAKQTHPSLYKLKPSTEQDSVCLITDFPSPNTSLIVNGKTNIVLNDIAVLDKSTDNNWRYSTVVLEGTGRSCHVKTPGIELESAEDKNLGTCSTTPLEHFKTNPSLNQISLTVLGLRVLTAKAIIFNLILTLRLWSS